MADKTYAAPTHGTANGETAKMAVALVALALFALLGSFTSGSEQAA